jgi:type IV pilus assembly protein PilC
MANYKWIGFTKDGKKTNGEIEADSEKQAKMFLRRQGIKPREVQAPSPFEIDLGRLLVDRGIIKPFKQEELVKFTTQLSTLINAGVPILECMEILSKQQKNPFLKSIIKKISDDVGGGKSLYEALEVHSSKGFGKLYVNLVKAGEAGGILDTILEKLGKHMENQERIRGAVKGAMMYPAIVSVVGTGVVIGLMVFVVPQFVGMLTDSGQAIPWVTQVVIDTSEIFQKYTLLMLPIVMALVIFILSYIKTPEGKVIFDRVVMKTPMFGQLVVKSNLASFTRTLSTMLSSGVSIIESLEICIETLDNTQIAKDIEKVRKAVTEGKSITEPLTRISYFPDLVAQMIKVGESTGNLDSMLLKVSDVFERELEVIIGTLTKMIEPLILVGLGGVIGFVMIAMYLPMFMSAGGAG